MVENHTGIHCMIFRYIKKNIPVVNPIQPFKPAIPGCVFNHQFNIAAVEIKIIEHCADHLAEGFIV